MKSSGTRDVIRGHNIPKEYHGAFVAGINRNEAKMNHSGNTRIWGTMR